MHFFAFMCRIICFPRFCTRSQQQSQNRDDDKHRGYYFHSRSGGHAL